jgi:1-pyrroline-5-carboxylate dehydrogenase
MREHFLGEVEAIQYGDPADFANFGGAVIDETAFAKQRSAIQRARATDLVDILAGGRYDDTEGYFVRPTVLACSDPTDEVFSAPSTSGRSSPCTSTTTPTSSRSCARPPTSRRTP